MLDSIRKRSSNFVFSFIILAVVAVMALYGIGGGDPAGSSGGAAVWVNGEPITNGEFQQQLESRLAQYQNMFGGQYDEKLLAQLRIPQRTLDEMIQMKLLAQQSHRLNFRVSDKELVEYIRSIPYFQKDGKFDVELYRRIPNPGLQEKRQREALLLSKFQNYLTNRIQLPPEEVETAFDIRETKVNLSYAKIDFEKIAEKRPLPKDIVKTFLETQPPERFNAYYSSHKPEFTEKAKVKLRQIRVGIPFKATAEQKAKAKEKIETVQKELSGANFAAMAKKHSDDEYGKKGGLVGWVDKGSLEAPLEAALASLTPGQPSGPVETTFGYFILLVEDKKDENVKTLDEVKPQIAEALAEEQFRKDFVTELRDNWNKQLAEGKSLTAEFKKYGINVEKTGPFSLADGYVPKIGQGDDVLEAIFTLSEDKPVYNKLVSHQGNDFYIKLDDLQQPKESEFSKNREAIERSLGTSLQTALLTQWVESLRKSSSITQEVQFQDSPTQLPN